MLYNFAMSDVGCRMPDVGCRSFIIVYYVCNSSLVIVCSSAIMSYVSSMSDSRSGFAVGQFTSNGIQYKCNNFYTDTFNNWSTFDDIRQTRNISRRQS